MSEEYVYDVEGSPPELSAEAARLWGWLEGQGASVFVLLELARWLVWHAICVSRARSVVVYTMVGWVKALGGEDVERNLNRARMLGRVYGSGGQAGAVEGKGVGDE